MRVYNCQLPTIVHGAVNINASDVPASQKMQGAASHSHLKHPCNFCFILLDEINTKKAYDPSSKVFILFVSDIF